MGLTLRGYTLEISANSEWRMVASCICKGIKHHSRKKCDTDPSETIAWQIGCPSPRTLIRWSRLAKGCRNTCYWKHWHIKGDANYTEAVENTKQYT